ncbi:MAG: biosynthetic arginine decarboxylase, partial [Kiritimatiellia bacterium]|nr:biosynthetic arginine decarboxylase [Kiritimatiellia bacterium]
KDPVTVSLMDIATGMKARGFGMPLLVRFGDILQSRIEILHQSFGRAIQEAGYKGSYRGVYPIKVNQQQWVVEQVVENGRPFHHGLEAGSKAELIIALSYMQYDPEAILVCNGYKDEEFIDLALYGQKMGLNPFLVVEMPSELPMILERAARMNIRPRLGIRAKLSTKVGGHWGESAGDRGMFGLNVPQIVDLVDTLRQADRLDCLQMLHYHLGSQIPNIRSVQTGLGEASRLYASLVREGAPMGFLNVGGGLAVDYDGSHTNFASSSNYSVDEYAADVVESIQRVVDDADIPHPVIVSESGRATVAHHSVLLFNVLGVTRFGSHAPPEDLADDISEPVRNLMDVSRQLSARNLQESYHDAVHYREEARALFDHGIITLRERALGDRIFWHVISRIVLESGENKKYIPDELSGLREALADVYHGNFSVFQSLPDSWAIDQLFPVLPIHRLRECPTRDAVIADITCDCDGKINRFVDLQDVRHTLRLHTTNGTDYVLGVFLVGAYQETLGDLHNLFGDTNVVNVRVGTDGRIEYAHEIDGDSVSDVLSYVEFEPQEMQRRIRARAEAAVREGRLSAEERREILSAYETGLRGYTYYEV